MKMPGVSLIAVARPMPMPPRRRRRGQQQQVAATRNSSNMLTWPKLTVSRTGSNAATRPNAMAEGEPELPALPLDDRADEPGEMHPSATTFIVTLIAIAVCQPMSAMGDISAAANGG